MFGTHLTEPLGDVVELHDLPDGLLYLVLLVNLHVLDLKQQAVVLHQVFDDTDLVARLSESSRGVTLKLRKVIVDCA